MNIRKEHKNVDTFLLKISINPKSQCCSGINYSIICPNCWYTSCNLLVVVIVLPVSAFSSFFCMFMRWIYRQDLESMHQFPFNHAGLHLSTDFRCSCTISKNTPRILFEHNLIILTTRCYACLQLFPPLILLPPFLFPSSGYPSSTCANSACATWRAAASFTSTWRSVTGSTHPPTRSTGRMRSLCLR